MIFRAYGGESHIIYAYVYTMHTHAYIYTCTHIHTNIHTHKHIHNTHICIHTYSYTYAYINTYTHAYLHTHTHLVNDIDLVHMSPFFPLIIFSEHRKQKCGLKMILGADQENSGGLKIHTLESKRVKSLLGYICFFNNSLNFAPLPMSQAWVIGREWYPKNGGACNRLMFSVACRQISLWSTQIKFFPVAGLWTGADLHAIIFHLIYKWIVIVDLASFPPQHEQSTVWLENLLRNSCCFFVFWNFLHVCYKKVAGPFMLPSLKGQLWFRTK